MKFHDDNFICGTELNVFGEDRRQVLILSILDPKIDVKRSSQNDLNSHGAAPVKPKLNYPISSNEEPIKVYFSRNNFHFSFVN